ncbi:hypothetical protein [Tropicimonas sp. IMCC34043]|uniref:hypothetical protein n=1 Tax=Tropicimonas sp. IMCC34043 TaxID=2248760 RepID=UPI0018E54737|nr:hypothetical protein [Tropicimonas sp. IMCC34043]
MLRAWSLPAVAALAIALSPITGFAQSAPPPHKPLEKTIGQARPDIVPSLIVMNSAGATLADGTLTLKGIAGNAIVFADRPVRSAGHAPTAVLLDEWNPAYPDSFYADPPNATVSVFGETEKNVYDAVVTLTNPRMEGADLMFDVAVLEGSLDGASGPAAVFIDLIGRPLTPLSFAGVARRTAYRGAFYAAGAEAAARPYGPYSEPCGYAPYPPCR